MRPVLIIQNNKGNMHSPTVIVAAITSKTYEKILPTHIKLSARTLGLGKKSVILTEQIRTIDKKRLRERISILDDDSMELVNEALKISLGVC